MAIIRSKWPDINIPENLSLSEFVFKNFDIYGNRPAIVRIVLYFSLISVKWFVLFYVNLLIPFLRSAECFSVWFCGSYSPYSCFLSGGRLGTTSRCIKRFNFTPFGCVVEKYIESNKKY